MRHSASRGKSSTRARTVILTVGSTHFTPLVQAALDQQVIEALIGKGFTHFTVQHGKSTLPSTMTAASARIQLELLDFTPDIEERMAASGLVISHAGAGSILAAVRGPALSPFIPGNSAPPQLIIVPNDSLMDSHQTDLADELEARGWATVVTANAASLAHAILSLPDDVSTASTSFPAFDGNRLQSILDAQMSAPR